MPTYSNIIPRTVNGGYYKYLDCNGSYNLLGDIHCDRILMRGLVNSAYSLNAQIVEGSGSINIRRGIRCSTATWTGFSVVHSPMQVTGQLNSAAASSARANASPARLTSTVTPRSKISSLPSDLSPQQTF